MSTQLHAPLKVLDDAGLVPMCPHCDSPLDSIRAKRLDPVGPGAFRFGKRYAYACPNCNKLLGITHRKGFWMG